MVDSNSDRTEVRLADPATITTLGGPVSFTAGVDGDTAMTHSSCVHMVSVQTQASRFLTRISGPTLYILLQSFVSFSWLSAELSVNTFLLLNPTIAFLTVAAHPHKHNGTKT